MTNFTEGELVAARMRVAMRRAARALRNFRLEWDVATARIRALEASKREARERRMRAAEAYVQETS